MKSIEFLQTRIDGLNAQIANGLSEEARAEVTKTIAGLEAAINEIKDLQASAEQGEKDNSPELLSQVREIVARVQALENELKTPKIDNKMNKITSSKTYERKFFDMVQNSLSRDDFKKNLKSLAVENGINISNDGIDELLPAAVLKEVNDVFSGHRHRLLELVDWTGLPAFKSFFEYGNEIGQSWPSVLLGENASATPKIEQNLSFTPVTIRPQFVYKKISIDKEIVKASEADGSVLMRYIVRELLDRLLCTIENLILKGGVGMGGSIENNSSFIPPMQVENVQSFHAMHYLPHTASSDLIAIVDPGTYIALKQNLLNNIGYYIPDEYIAKDFFGVNEVVFTPKGWVAPTNYTWAKVMFMNPRNYKLVGDQRPDQYEDFNLEWNRVDYLMEMWIGGGSITPEFITLKETYELE